MNIMDLIFENKEKKIHELITEDTWCQHRPNVTNDQGIVCGMCLSAWVDVKYRSLSDTEHLKLRNRMFKFLMDNYGSGNVPAWNDAKVRKFDEVLQFCKELDL